ncbi:branched-chain amino acid ABC transporter permease [Ilumatobacter sp.]|uniref:branched-chain amino acid ABC transporter permease n=1 Tax=Ilumatobacter sp. TaxID=1967498 RepID=UPI003C5D8B39
MSDQHHEGDSVTLDHGEVEMAEELVTDNTTGLPIHTPEHGALHWVGRVLVFAIPLAYLLLRVFGVTGIFGDGWSNSGLGLLADALITAIAVMGVNLITGYTGQLSIGHAAFFAIGAYTGIVLTDGRISLPVFGPENLWDPGWTIPVAAIVCFVIGCVVGLPALRLKGIYLALTTLVFVEAVRSFLKYEEFESITGGSTGIKGEKYSPPEYVFDFFGLKLPTGLDGRGDLNQWMIYLSLGLLLFIMLLVSGLMRSRIGRAMVATRDNELAAEVMGVHLAVVKTVVFGLSGAITGVGGALFGLKLGLVDGDVPQFGLFGAITLLVAMVVGGAAQNWGPLIGALFYVFVNNLARTVGENPSDSALGFLFSEGTKLDGLGGVLFGVMLILFARFAPFGAVGTFRILRAKVVQIIPHPPKGSKRAQAAASTSDD